MNCIKYYLALIFSLLMTACASNQWEPSEVEEVFVTKITPGGLKIFDYSLTNAALQTSGNGKRGGGGKGAGKHGGDKGGGAGGNGRMGGGKPVNESSMKPYFNDMLEAKLKKSGYCREGYVELDRYFGRGQLQMRGECEESATEEDRIKYINKGIA